MYLVGGHPAGQQEVGHLPVELRQLPDVLPLGVGRQPQQPFRLVVGEEEPAAAVGDQHPFAYGVQHRVVVLVHPGHLEGAEPAGLAAQAPADQCGAGGGQGEGRRAGAEDDGQLPLEHTGDVLHREAGRHEGHDRAAVLVGVGEHGDHGLDLLAQGSLHALGVHLAGQ